MSIENLNDCVEEREMFNDYIEERKNLNDCGEENEGFSDGVECEMFSKKQVKY